ncbi:11-beta-hydroxysteroid dehydrogenase-like 6 isoform X2 [Rhododendron vialii]|uniref:11-beta-hydroxysteroid dehydrogenase-like 6 isoform X2 n=1 Tax=Rhododendron vialii TaxID=182163 RepID=UPI00265D991A|nr:11-beta-hydroxysteroid dehydrogenase-like 6 isoform X2 [Rhododendron vialii]
MLPLLSSMDSIHKLLNIVLPLISLLSLFIFLPPILLFKISSSILRSVFSENVSEKVVLITGASSGIGKHLAYEYAKGGACLVLVARRQKQLQEVACKARQLGSPDVIIETGDVSKVEDLDHLVNNAGIGPVCMFEDATNVDDFAPIMNINFWGSVYCTHFAIPHLRKSRGKIVVIASIVQLRPIPRVSIYSASKGALVSFYETLRVEVGSDIGITIVAPGLIDSEMTKGESTSKAGMDGFPVESTEGCTKAIFKSICRGDRYLIEPAWVRLIHLWNLLCPEAIESFIRWVLITRPNNSNPNPNSGQLKAD